jgi:AcrR family transcriptional regulator
MSTPSSSFSPRVAATRAALLRGAVEEISAFGLRRSSMEGVARRAGVSRATLYLHWKGKDELFRAVVQDLHDEHVTAMEAALADEALDFEARVLAVLEARFLRFVELTAGTPHAAELYDLHSRLCGDIAQASQERSERVLARLLRDAVTRGEADLGAAGLSPARVASVLYDCAHGAKGEDASQATPAEFRTRLAHTVRVLVAGLGASR